MVKNLPVSTGGVKDVGSVPGLGRPPGGGMATHASYSCLENPMDRRAWRATAHGSQRGSTEATYHAHVHNLVF